jgi:hypothetical protein
MKTKPKSKAMPAKTLAKTKPKSRTEPAPGWIHNSRDQEIWRTLKWLVERSVDMQEEREKVLDEIAEIKRASLARPASPVRRRLRMKTKLMAKTPNRVDQVETVENLDLETVLSLPDYMRCDKEFKYVMVPVHLLEEIAKVKHKFEEIQAPMLYNEDQVCQLNARMYVAEKILNCVLPRVGLNNFMEIIHAAGLDDATFWKRGAWADSTLPLYPRYAEAQNVD